VSKISKKYKEEVLDKYGINIDSSYRLAKKIVNRYTTVDEEGYLNICWSGKCAITDVWVDKDFLIDELNYNWKKLVHKDLYNYFLDIMVDELGFDSDFSLIVFANFVLPEIYDVYFKPLEPDYINESFRNHIDNEEKQKKYLDYIYNDLIKNTKWRDASFRDIDLYDGKCKSLQVGINWSTNPPSYNYIPLCLQNYLTNTWGLTYEEVKELFWGRYDKHVINMKLIRHQPYNLIESMDRNKKYEITKEDLKKLLYHYTVDMGYHKESAIEDLKDLIRWFNSLPNKIKLYRLLYLNDKNEINYDELGSHYSNNKRSLIVNHYNRGSIYGDMGEEAFLITVVAPKNKIDFIETITNNILFPNEQEITLEDKGRGVDFIKVEKL